jgi:tRNA (guanine26-N2/guanine27-N2)-dimethyltransferase
LDADWNCVGRVLLDETGKTIEGKTNLLVPTLSLTGRVPPKSPAFFNPSAKLSRDLSILVYRAFLHDSNRKQRTYADPLSGVGARAIRVAVEVQEIDEVYLNDLNPLAVELSKKNAALNFVERKCNFSVNEACKFLLSCQTKKGDRFAVLDLDPFGSPVPYLDCALRSVLDYGLISVTATDTAVLCGKFNDVCFRKYYARAIRCHYAIEIATRILLSQISLTASRFGLSIEPLFAHSYSQYIRVYARVKLSCAEANMLHHKLGFIQHCEKCGNRMASKKYNNPDTCSLCGNKFNIAGQLWISKMFDKALIKRMEGYNFNEVGPDVDNNAIVDRYMLGTCFEENDDIPYYFITDEIAAKLKTSPQSVSEVIDRLSRSGYRSSRTSFDSRGFKTDATINEILTLLR